MSKILDNFINFCKWPVAVYMLISLPALFSSVDFFGFGKLKYLALGGGFFAYYLGRTAMDSSVRATMQTIAHELTHSFFALLTFHKLKHIRLDQDGNGGEMSFEGTSNWLIVIAPYFFPLFMFIYMIISSFFPTRIVSSIILGYFLGYHTDTVSSQIHEKQTDLPKAGYLFCWLFLPGANLWVIGSTLAFNTHGWNGIAIYFNLINRLTVQYAENLRNMLF